MDAADYRAPDARAEERISDGQHWGARMNDDAGAPPARWPDSAAAVGIEDARANPVETPICDD
jgi:hypothetical protein